MTEILAFAAIMMIAIFFFEVAWRWALALILLGPPAYVAIVAGWFAARLGANVLWSIAVGLAAGAIVRILVFGALHWCVQRLESMTHTSAPGPYFD